MNLANKKDCKAWCDTSNGLALAVERACIPYERKLRASDDPRLKELSRFIYKLSQNFSTTLAKEMNRVRGEWGDTVPLTKALPLKMLFPRDILSHEPDDRIVIKDGWVILNYKYPYEIDLKRIPDEKALLRWALHLSGKTWMNTERLGILIEKVSESKGFHLYRTAL